MTKMPATALGIVTLATRAGWDVTITHRADVGMDAEVIVTGRSPVRSGFRARWVNSDGTPLLAHAYIETGDWQAGLTPASLKRVRALIECGA